MSVRRNVVGLHQEFLAAGAAQRDLALTVLRGLSGVEVRQNARGFGDWPNSRSIALSVFA